jgi:hypothetical protein
MNPLRRAIIFLSSITAVTGGLIVSLFMLSAYVANRPNGFVRKLPPHVATPTAVLDVGFNSYYIAGADSEGIYLANYTAPLNLLYIDFALADTTQIILKVPDHIKVVAGEVRIYVDSKNVYFTEGRNPMIRYGSVNDFVIDQVQDTTVSFLNSAPVSTRSSMGTYFDPVLKKTVLVRKSTGSDARIDTDILTKQVDGLFCMDGMLAFDNETNSFVYAYFYRNEFVRLDSNMNKVYNARTIDTTSRARISVETITSHEKTTMSTRPFMVNRKICMSEKWVFINSALRANNELDNILEEANPIDVYDLASGKYSRSFYIPVFKENKISSMRVFNNKMFVMMGTEVQAFELSL